MSDEDFWNDALKRGMKAFDQVDLLQKAEEACWKAAGKLPLIQQPPVIASCQMIGQEIDYILKNADALDKAIPNPAPEPNGRGQEASNAGYADAYTSGMGMSPGALQAAIDELLKQIRANGMTPALRAKLRGYIDASKKGGFSPPIYDPNAKWPPPNQPEMPDT